MWGQKPIPGYKFVSCTPSRLKAYVESKNLTEVKDFMHSSWQDSDGVIWATRMHGFASDIYSIAVTENEETVMLFSNMINKKENQHANKRI